jgi:hypothetical protein
VEVSQTGPSVGCMLTKILHYGLHRPEDFDKYEALCLSEQLAASARLVPDPKVPSYNAIHLWQKIASHQWISLRHMIRNTGAFSLALSASRTCYCELRLFYIFLLIIHI